jgi:hypothetical protein
MKEQIIILITIVAFFISSLTLAYIEKNRSDENKGKDWWALYFNDPKDENLDFTIENHSNRSTFNWEVLADGEKIQEAAFSIPKGEKKGFMATVRDIDGKKIIITATDGEKKKEIYKNFD